MEAFSINISIYSKNCSILPSVHTPEAKHCQHCQQQQKGVLRVCIRGSDKTALAKPHPLASFFLYPATNVELWLCPHDAKHRPHHAVISAGHASSPPASISPIPPPCVDPFPSTGSCPVAISLCRRLVATTTPITALSFCLCSAWKSSSRAWRYRC